MKKLKIEFQKNMIENLKMFEKLLNELNRLSKIIDNISIYIPDDKYELLYEIKKIEEKYLC